MSTSGAFFDLPLRTELVTSACRLRCAWCEHCRERELPPESTERLRAEAPPAAALAYRLKGGETFLLDTLDRWTQWARRDGRSRVCLEGPAASLAAPTEEALAARVDAIVRARPDLVSAMLPTVDARATARLTGLAWEPERALEALARVQAAGVAVEVLFPTNEETVAELEGVVTRVAERLRGATVTLRRMPLRRSARGRLPVLNAGADWPELDALSVALTQLPRALPHDTRLRMDEHAGYALCMLRPEARRADLINAPRDAFQKPNRALGAACGACAWARVCTWRAPSGPSSSPPPPDTQVNPLTRDEALAMQSQTGAATATHQPRSFRTDRRALGLPELLCLAPWTTLTLTEPKLHPVPCALSWVDTAITPAQSDEVMGEAPGTERARRRPTPHNDQGFHWILDNESLSLTELWNAPLLRLMRREMLDGAASSRCRPMCRVVMGVEERGLTHFQRDDADLPRAVAENRRRLLDEVNARKNALTARPLELMIGVSANCNISCGFCDGPLGAYGDLTDKRRDEIVELLPTLMAFGVSGPGEPLMSPNYLRLLAVIADGEYPALRMSLTTNGTLITPSFLERHQRVPWSQVRISINAGSAATHESMTGKRLFDRVRENLDALCALRDRRPVPFKVTLSCVLGDKQIGDLHNFAELVNSHGTDVIVEPMYGDLRGLSPWTRPARLAVLADELRSVADDYAVKNPPLSRAFRAVERYAVERLAHTDWRPLDHH